MDDKKKKLNDVLKVMKKKYGETSVFKGEENLAVAVETISTGSLSLDAALLCGGYPKGRLIEVSGPEAGGKTLLCLLAIKKGQEAGEVCAFIDAEHTLDRAWCIQLGINYDELIICRPEFMEDALSQIGMLAKSGAVSLIVWDSVPALSTKREAEGKMEDVTVGAHARGLTKALRLFTPIFHQNGVTGLFINQVREKIGATGPRGMIMEGTPGGRALKHHCSVRIKVRKVGGSDIKDDMGRVIGHRIRAKVAKNKVSTAQNTQAEFNIIYDSGIDTLDELVTVGLSSGIIEKPNKVMYKIGETSIKGIGALKEHLEAHPDQVKDLEKRALEAVRSELKTVRPEDEEGIADEPDGDDEEFLDLEE